MIPIRTLLKEDHYLGKHDNGIERDCPECQDICDHPPADMIGVPTISLPDREAPPEDITLVICKKCNKELSASEVRERSNGQHI